MGLSWPRFAVFYPLFNSLVLLPGVVSCEGFCVWETWIIEDLVLLLKNLKCLLGSLVFGCIGVYLLQECFFSDDVFMFSYYIGMSGRQALNLN